MNSFLSFFPFASIFHVEIHDKDDCELGAS